MAVYKLVENLNLILTIPIEKCSEDLNRKELKDNLIDTMEHYNGVGLSANQCGVMERVFVMYSDINKKEIIACFNPKIVEESSENILMDEGCLTYPGIWLKVSRPDHIACSFEDENGELNEVEMFGLEARIFQHEYDHMIGTNFTKLVSKLRLDMAKKRAKKQLKKFARLAS
jgi:peptide deformylase